MAIALADLTSVHIGQTSLLLFKGFFMFPLLGLVPVLPDGPEIFCPARGSFSSVAHLTCGGPQGSILSPILFLLYMLSLGQILASHNILLHCYADDMQSYLPLRHSGQSALPHCLADTRDVDACNLFKS